MEPFHIRVELIAEPAALTEQTLPTLTIRGIVTNLGSHTVDTQGYASELLVDDQPSMAWSMAIGNGARDARERALPPGERVELKRVMGSGLFKEPGDHTLVLRVRGVASNPVKVHLAPIGPLVQ
jgi:hypothetical protein